MAKLHRLGSLLRTSSEDQILLKASRVLVFSVVKLLYNIDRPFTAQIRTYQLLNESKGAQYKVVEA